MNFVCRGDFCGRKKHVKECEANRHADEKPDECGECFAVFFEEPAFFHACEVFLFFHGDNVVDEGDGRHCGEKDHDKACVALEDPEGEYGADYGVEPS